MSEPYQWFDEHAEAALRRAVEPVIDVYGNGTHFKPDGGTSYDCESCPATFGFLPEDMLCPLCHGQLTGQVTVNFYLPYPPEPEVECATCGGTATLISSRDGSEVGYCSAHWPAVKGGDS